MLSRKKKFLDKLDAEIEYMSHEDSTMWYDKESDVWYVIWEES